MSAIQGLLKYWSEWKDSWDFQNCPLYHRCPLLRGVHQVRFHCISSRYNCWFSTITSCFSYVCTHTCTVMQKDLLFTWKHERVLFNERKGLCWVFIPLIESPNMNITVHISEHIQIKFQNIFMSSISYSEYWGKRPCGVKCTHSSPYFYQQLRIFHSWKWS